MAQLIATATSYHRPETLAELSDLFSGDDSSTFIVAGGTSMAFSQPSVQRIFDMSRLPLKGCHSLPNGSLEIGALTTIGELEKLLEIISFCGGILCQATDKLASTPLRNLITVGGNLAAGFAWSDLPVALLALDTRYRVYEISGSGTGSGAGTTTTEAPTDGARPLPINGDISFRQLAGRQQIITHIIPDGRYAKARGAFTKFARTASDLALVSVAVTYVPDKNRMQHVRVVAGGLVSTPLRLTQVEALLEGQIPDQKLFEQAGQAAVVTVRPDTRASADYRLDVLKTLIARTCLRAMGADSDEN